MRFFDSHCHLDFPEFEPDRGAVMTRAREAGVVDVLVPGFDSATWSRAAGLVRVAAERGLRVHVAVGVHPYALANDEAQGPGEPDGALAFSLVAAARRHGAVAIGECGVDAPLARRHGAAVSLGRQLAVFREHVLAADTAKLPLVLHVVRAHEPVLNMLRSGRRSRSQANPERPRGVVHAYSGSAELAREYVRLGFMLAFGGALTHPSHERARAAARGLDDEHLLVESDAPSGRLAGGPRRNEPGAVREVVAALAELRGQAPEHVAELTSANARALYRL